MKKREYGEEERRLMFDIMLNALDCLTGKHPGRMRRKKAAKLAVEAAQWLYSDEDYYNPDLGISFVHVCNRLKIDPVRVRRELKKGPEKLRKKMLKLKHKEAMERSLL